MTCDLQSPDNADTASRGTTIRLTPRNSYAPLRNESGSPTWWSDASVEFRGVYVVVVRRRRRYVTRRRRYAILFYFRKLNLHYVLQQKFENDSSSYRKLEDCTLHIVHVLHTLHICDVQP